MTDARAVVALGTLHAIARQMSYPTARVARLLATSPTAEIAISSSSSVIPGPTARRLGARTRNVADLAAAIAFRSCAATAAGSTPESTGTGLRLGAIARDVAFPPTAVAGLRFLFHRTVSRYVALHAAVIAGGRARLGAVCSLVSKSTAVETSTCTSHESFFFSFFSTKREFTKVQKSLSFSKRGEESKVVVV
ncbi:hypothetical protein H4582DRAFT_1901836 [Lactarius indigo]|nr:hypothetical protein H4582DRAFT_1901836 [Lactarius indigo]